MGWSLGSLGSNRLLSHVLGSAVMVVRVEEMDVNTNDTTANALKRCHIDGLCDQFAHAFTHVLR